jgi:toxin YoeB
MKITFSKISWDEYISWQNEDKKIVRKTNALIKDIERHPFEDLGKPEPLKFDLSGYWSRRITGEHRLVYQYVNNEILIYSCQYHYDI